MWWHSIHCVFVASSLPHSGKCVKRRCIVSRACLDAWHSSLGVLLCVSDAGGSVCANFQILWISMMNENDKRMICRTRRCGMQISNVPLLHRIIHVTTQCRFTALCSVTSSFLHSISFLLIREFLFWSSNVWVWYHHRNQCICITKSDDYLLCLAIRAPLQPTKMVKFRYLPTLLGCVQRLKVRWHSLCA